MDTFSDTFSPLGALFICFVAALVGLVAALVLPNLAVLVSRLYCCGGGASNREVGCVGATWRLILATGGLVDEWFDVLTMVAYQQREEWGFFVGCLLIYVFSSLVVLVASAEQWRATTGLEQIFYGLLGLLGVLPFWLTVWVCDLRSRSARGQTVFSKAHPPSYSDHLGVTSATPPPAPPTVGGAPPRAAVH